MSVLYVSEQGAVVVKRGQRLEVLKGGAVLESIHGFKLEQVAVFGNVHLTPQVISFLLAQRIDTVFLSTAGAFRGRLASGEGRNVVLRREQFRRCDETDFAVELARRFVRGKVQNCRTVLRRHQREVGRPEVEAALLRMGHSLGKLNGAVTLDEVRGWEGAAAAAYFGCFGLLIGPPGFPFGGRTRRPPRDAVNALLSFGYTMLLGTITTCVQTVGLDPYLGSLHAAENGKPSLVLDLMEEFRPLLVDALVLRAINRRQMTPDDFEYQEYLTLPEGVEETEPPSREEYPVLMRRESMRKWILEYESVLRTRVTYSRFGVVLSYRSICLEQARLLARHITGEEPYESFVVR